MKFKWWVKPPEEPPAESRLKPVVTDRPDKPSKEQEAIWEEHRKQAWARERQEWLNQPVVIDGEMKTCADLDATKHRLSGSFRPPEYPMSYMNYCSRCHCTYYGYRNERDSHWLKGCQDILQYVTIPTKASEAENLLASATLTDEEWRNAGCPPPGSTAYAHAVASILLNNFHRRDKEKDEMS